MGHALSTPRINILKKQSDIFHRLFGCKKHRHNLNTEYGEPYAIQIQVSSLLICGTFTGEYQGTDVNNSTDEECFENRFYYEKNDTRRS